MTEITFHTEERDGVQLFFVSESLREKSRTLKPGRCKHVTCTHTNTYLSDRTWLFIYISIYPRDTNTGFFPLSCPPFLSSPPLPLPLHRSVKALTHRRTDPDTYTPLSRCLSRHLPPSLSPLTHTCMHTHALSGS